MELVAVAKGSNGSSRSRPWSSPRRAASAVSGFSRTPGFACIGSPDGRRSRSRSPTTSSPRPSVSAPTAPTARRCGTTAASTASSAGREVRIEPVAGGVDVEPCDDGIAREVGLAPRPPARPRRLLGVGLADPVLAALREPLAGYRPPLAPDPWEMLVTLITAQQVSLHSAFAVRARLTERFGVRHEHAWAFPTRERIAAADESEIREVGFSTRKAEYVTALARSPLDFAALQRASRRARDRVDHRAARARPLECRLVPRSRARAGRRLAGRRPRRAQGGLVLLRFRQRSRRDGGAGGGRAVRFVAQRGRRTCCSPGSGCTDERPQRDRRRPSRARGVLARVRGGDPGAAARGGRRRDRAGRDP